MTEFWLVRHGQTDWNIARRYQGHADIPLNQVGIDQAFALAKLFAAETFIAIYSSDLSRASQTATIVGHRLGLSVFIDSRLREICQGDWEGMSLDEVKENYAADFSRGASDPSSTRAPGGESVSEVAARMAQVANEIQQKHPAGKVLIISHGLAVSTLYCQAAGISLTQVYHHIPDNAVPMIITWKPYHSQSKSALDLIK
ncbi:MAG: putative phosphoglycerate mutase [Chloroflexi bacterium]|nr:MAG: putative phosphoglycerate mutase [Chloroflexota bacterium]